MSKADKMFEELGYKKMNKKQMKDFFIDDKIIECAFVNKDKRRIWFSIKKIWNFYGCSMQELKAINEKVKELGWEV